jgi:stearoyl-CoA desaturase (delta-9 desaturase)
MYIKLSNIQQCNILFLIQIISYISIPLVFLFGDFQQIVVGIILSFLFYTIGISLTYHRFITHKGFILNKSLEKIFVLFGALASQGSPVAWAALHRAHHKYSDTNLDSHSPKSGILKSVLFSMYPNKNVNYMRFSANLLKNSFYKTIHNNYFKIIFAYIIIIALVFGVESILYYYLFPVAWGWAAIGSINYFCHRTGYRNFNTPDQSTNNKWLILLAHGENLHNNHHYDQSNYNFSKIKGEFDPIFIFIIILKKSKLIV